MFHQLPNELNDQVFTHLGTSDSKRASMTNRLNRGIYIDQLRRRVDRGNVDLGDLWKTFKYPAYSIKEIIDKDLLQELIHYALHIAVWKQVTLHRGRRQTLTRRQVPLISSRKDRRKLANIDTHESIETNIYKVFKILSEQGRAEQVLLGFAVNRGDILNHIAQTPDFRIETNLLAHIFSAKHTFLKNKETDQLRYLDMYVKLIDYAFPTVPQTPWWIMRAAFNNNREAELAKLHPHFSMAGYLYLASLIPSPADYAMPASYPGEEDLPDWEDDMDVEAHE